jgi:hypothetical protein
MVSIDASNGVPSWAAPIGGGFTYNAPSVANGVVWTLDSPGYLNGYDQQTGLLLVKRQIAADVGANSLFQTDTSGGIAIAHHTLYTAAASYLVAYRPGNPASK